MCEIHYFLLFSARGHHLPNSLRSSINISLIDNKNRYTFKYQINISSSILPSFPKLRLNQNGPRQPNRSIVGYRNRDSSLIMTVSAMDDRSRKSHGIVAKWLTVSIL